MTHSTRSRLRACLVAATAALLMTACGIPSLPVPTDAPEAPATQEDSSTASPDHNVHWVAEENSKPGTPGWSVPEATNAGDRELAAYFDAVSVEPGGVATLYATSTVGDFDLKAFRLGWYGGVGAREVWHSTAPITGLAQSAPLKASDGTISTNWQPTTTVDTAGWPEGSYLFLMTAKKGSKTRYVPLVVRTPQHRGRLALMAPVLTNQAYNAWGGYSLYHGPDNRFTTRSSRVSFDRPYDRNGAMETFKFDLPIIQRAERLDLDYSYTTTWDVDRYPDTLRGARGIVSLGHDEYWTVPLRDAVEKARDAGTNLAFLGANAVYWRVRLESGGLGDGRLVAGYKEAKLDPVVGPTTTALWRQSPAPRPENSLTGMLYECYPVTADLRVEEENFFLFRGTGATRKKPIPGLIGLEIDRAYPIAGTPANLQVVAHSPVQCPHGGQTFSDMTYYTAPSGAGVFSVGTMGWVNALSERLAGTKLTQASVQFSRTVTDNLLVAMAAGPMGREHPAIGNVASLKLSAATTTGTGEPVHSDSPTASPSPRPSATPTRR